MAAEEGELRAHHIVQTEIEKFPGAAPVPLYVGGTWRAGEATLSSTAPDGPVTIG